LLFLIITEEWSKDNSTFVLIEKYIFALYDAKIYNIQYVSLSVGYIGMPYDIVFNRLLIMTLLLHIITCYHNFKKI